MCFLEIFKDYVDKMILMDGGTEISLRWSSMVKPIAKTSDVKKSQRQHLMMALFVIPVAKQARHSFQAIAS